MDINNRALPLVSHVIDYKKGSFLSKQRGNGVEEVSDHMFIFSNSF